MNTTGMGYARPGSAYTLWRQLNDPNQRLTNLLST